MKKIIPILSGVLIMFSAVTSHAGLLDAWDFFGLTNTTATSVTPATIAATVGSGSLDVSAFGVGSPQGTSPQRTEFAGTQLNTFAGSLDTTGNGASLALANSTANGKSLVFSFSMLGYEDLVVSFATQGTGTGFNSGIWSWSNDGVNYTSLTNNTASRVAFAVATVDFSSAAALDNDSTVYLEYTLSGATSASGNNRIDNIQFNATPIPTPEPSSVALATIGGIACFFAARRKR